MKPKTTQADPLVLVSLGGWSTMLMPKSIATQLVTNVLTGKIQTVESNYVAGKTIYYDRSDDVRVTSMSGVYMDGLPTDDSTLRQRYFDWLKSKAALVGDGYVLDTFATYKETLDESEPHD